MAQNFGNLNRDLMGRDLFIGAKEIIDSERNLKNVKTARINGKLTVRGDICVSGRIIGPDEIRVVFPGDSSAEIPDYVICGGGCVGLSIAKTLSDDLQTRVLVLEMGNDNTQNGLVKYPFWSSQYRGTGPEELNAVNVLLDPKISSFNGAPQGPGDAFRLYPLWTGTGIGGGNQHFLLDCVNPVQRDFDGPLPSQIIPPNNTSTYDWQSAGGSAWSYANINTITKSLQDFIFVGGGPGFSENLSERGTSGPTQIMQLQAYPPTGVNSLVQNALSSASTSVPGGTTSTLIADYNCNTSFADSETQLNGVSQNQNFLSNAFVRQGSQTTFIDGITAADGFGNQVGVGGRKLVILTGCTVISPIKDEQLSSTLYAAKGVSFLQNNILKTAVAKNVICSMGAGYSPRFWELGGIGNANVLSNLGIPMQVNSPLMGTNLNTQYGPLFVGVTDNPAFAGANFFGQSFVQYNNVKRSFQCVPFTLPVSVGIVQTPPIPSPTPGTYLNLFNLDGFISHPRARGFSHSNSKNFVPQLDFSWGFYTDVPDTTFTGSISGTTLTVTVAPAFPLLVGQTIVGPGVPPGTVITANLTGPTPPTPGVAATYIAGTGTYTLNQSLSISSTVMSLDPNDPMSGLSDVNSDMSVSCAFADYLYQFLLDLRSADLAHTYNYISPANIETILAVTPALERWRQLAIILPFAISVAAHEAGTVVMNNDPSKGVCDGNLKLHGTLNCFEADFGVAPLQNAANPTAMLMSLGVNAAPLVKSVSLT